MAVNTSASTHPDGEYIRNDFESWDITYALRNHAPAENRHARGLSASEAKEEVFNSPRLQRIIQEVSVTVRHVTALYKPRPLRHKHNILRSIILHHFYIGLQCRYVCVCLDLQVCEEGGCSKEEIEGEVRVILAEMGHSMFLPAVRFLALLLRPFVRSALRGIFVNREGLEQVSS